MPPAKKSQAPASFEAAIERIEQIAARMEAGDLPLEELINAYEEGVGLLRFCSERLGSVEKRLQILARDASGRLTGLQEVADPAENEHSTPGATPATGNDLPDTGEDPARLF